MATNERIQADIDAFLAGELGKFDDVEREYAAGHRGRFWQGIETPAAPDDGAKKAADKTKKPTDQAEAWADVFKDHKTLPDNWPCALRVDVYDGPRGVGWVLTAAYTKGVNRWSRSLHTGPETGRERGWTSNAV